jgi:hypothetical protein
MPPTSTRSIASSVRIRRKAAGTATDGSANVAWQLPIAKLTAFAYVLDFEPLTSFPGLSAAQRLRSILSASRLLPTVRD